METTQHPSTSAARTWAAIESRLSKDPAGDDFNTTHEICSRYASDPRRMALVVCHEDQSVDRWTYRELDQMAARAARMFANAGLRRGDRVAGLLSRQVESWITALAAWRSGLVYVPLFGGFAADAIGVRVKAAGVSAVVVDHHYRAELAMAQNALDLEVTVFVTGGSATRPASEDRSFWGELEAVHADGPKVPTSLNDTATLLFTSGTTGTPKACAMTHASFLSVMPYADSVLGATGESILFSTADPAWAFGLYSTGAAVMALGATRVMYSGRFVAEAWHRVARQENATILATAPAALSRLAQQFAVSGATPTLQTVATAGEPLTAALARAWDATGAPPVRNGYGLSEVGMLLGDVRGNEALASHGVLTAAIPGFEPFVSDREGQQLPDGEAGLVAVRRPKYQMSKGYENAPTLWSDNWRGDVFITEDRAIRDSRGRWQILGRDDDMIIASGHNISPVEVENALLQHPCVVDAAAVSYPDPARGEVVRAVVVKSPDAPPEDALTAQLVDLVSQLVGRYASPRRVDFAMELPRTEVGKLRRAALRGQTDPMTNQ